MENESLVLSVKEVCRETKCSRGLIYQAIKEDRFPHIHIGKRILIPKKGFEEFLSGQWQPLMENKNV